MTVTSSHSFAWPSKFGSNRSLKLQQYVTVIILKKLFYFCTTTCSSLYFWCGVVYIFSFTCVRKALNIRDFQQLNAVLHDGSTFCTMLHRRFHVQILHCGEIIGISNWNVTFIPLLPFRSENETIIVVFLSLITIQWSQLRSCVPCVDIAHDPCSTLLSSDLNREYRCVDITHLLSITLGAH